jgi:hypothetical protein
MHHNAIAGRYLRIMRYAWVVGVIVALMAAAPASAASNLWATVNVCDTPANPGKVGLRASMPGKPRGTRRWMRFRLQYQDGDRWRYVKNADSAWRTLSKARGRRVESGWTFSFGALDQATTFRGVVRFQWRRGDRVVRRAHRITEAGHVSTAGADPAGYSAATCSIG